MRVLSPITTSLVLSFAALGSAVATGSQGGPSVQDVNATDSTEIPETPAPPQPVFALGDPTFFGSGCPTDTVVVVPSTDGQTVSVLFSEFMARTASAVNRERNTCNLAVPVDVQSGISIGIFRVDYRGNAYVPDERGSYAKFDAEYYFAGQRGPKVSERYGPGTDEDLFISHDVGVAAVVWSPCGASTNLRINAALTAAKRSQTEEDTEVVIDSVDTTVETGFHYYITTRKCSQEDADEQ